MHLCLARCRPDRSPEDVEHLVAELPLRIIVVGELDLAEGARIERAVLEDVALEFVVPNDVPGLRASTGVRAEIASRIGDAVRVHLRAARSPVALAATVLRRGVAGTRVAVDFDDGVSPAVVGVAAVERVAGRAGAGDERAGTPDR